jgi:hypothetical protein
LLSNPAEADDPAGEAAGFPPEPEPLEDSRFSAPDDPALDADAAFFSVFSAMDLHRPRQFRTSRTHNHSDGVPAHDLG